ncbi:MAG: DUF1732 domain-containing protein, partial [Deltaproteobacteria bacterium]|nr:DUF1732 domain-containing protein [Deltaproteobacteria bacterium]
ILARLGVIGTTLEQIEAVFPAALQERQTALQERVAALCGDVEIDEARMVQELAIMADKSDVTEELVRAKSHIKQFRQWFDTSEPVGRKLDFLLQEINREVNTIGSKSSDSEIALSVVAVKNELEKIREQIQNVM